MVTDSKELMGRSVSVLRTQIQLIRYTLDGMLTLLDPWVPCNFFVDAEAALAKAQEALDEASASFRPERK
jgi:hypothetical protein